MKKLLTGLTLMASVSSFASSTLPMASLIKNYCFTRSWTQINDSPVKPSYLCSSELIYNTRKVVCLSSSENGKSMSVVSGSILINETNQYGFTYRNAKYDYMLGDAYQESEKEIRIIDKNIGYDYSGTLVYDLTVDKKSLKGHVYTYDLEDGEEETYNLKCTKL